MSENVLTPEFRVSYPNVFEKAKPSPKYPGTPKYQITMIFYPRPELDTAPYDRIHGAVYPEEYGLSGFKYLTPMFNLLHNTAVLATGQNISRLKHPGWKYGGEPQPGQLPPFDYAKHPYYRGAIVMNAKNQFDPAPGVVDAKTGLFILDRSKLTPKQLVEAGDFLGREHFYPGCWAQAAVNAYGGDWGVSLGLQNVLKTRDDEPFAAGRSDALSDFAAVLPPKGVDNASALGLGGI